MSVPAGPAFVHLRVHSEFSVLDGIVRSDDAIAAAVKDRQPALALTDLGNLFGLVRFYKAARGKGVKPVAGCDVWIENTEDRDQPFRVLVLVQNHAGYLRLCDWLTRAYTTNQYRGRAELKREWLLTENEGLLVLAGGREGEVCTALMNGNRDAALRVAKEWAAAYPNRYYLEVQRPGWPDDDLLVNAVVDLAGELELPVVATHPVQYMAPDDFKAHEARCCIAEGYVLADTRRPKRFTREQYFKTTAEMATLFADLPEALANAVEIAKRCNLKLTLGKNYLPNYPTPDGMSLGDYLGQLAAEGLEERLAELFPDPNVRADKRPEYVARLEFEVKTIIQMGFPGYFLIVADFINWAKNNGCPVGPGRGSGAGSLVAYSLRITDLDPLKYALLFERFLNPERVSMPDFDVDFCQDNRERVIDYVKEKYGRDAVSQIATFGTMAAKAVVRDVGRVLDLPYGFVDTLSKLIPFEIGMTLAKAREMEPQINERCEAEEEVRELFELAEKLEGMTRNIGMHAGGVLIAPGKLTDFCPLYCAEGTDSVVSQYDKDDVEAVGLVKFDFLGLRTLTILAIACEFVEKVEGKTIDLDHLSLNDQPTYEIFRKANTTAVFQFESRGMKDMLTQARPDRLEDLIAMNALYRPGPMDLIPSFIARKHGKEPVTYLHPLLEPVLAPTYGIMVYQEQVMQAAQVIGGYSLGGADLLRRAMGKKKPEEMAKQRLIFVEGAAKKDIDEKLANEIFDYMEKFAGYGFNKSHSAAYAWVAYQTAYMKAHHCAAFMAATICTEMSNTDQVFMFYEDARANGISFLPPDINASGWRFEPTDRKTIRYGLGGIKGAGEAAIDAIVKARAKDGPFKDIFDFCRRIDRRIVNRRTIEALVKAGAFDLLHPDRAQLFASVGIAMEHAEQVERNASQSSLFGEPGVTENPGLAKVPSWTELERLQHEKSSLGFYFSGHPFHAYKKQLAGFLKTSLGRLEPRREPQMIAGIIIGVRVQVTKRGKVAFVTLDDGAAQVEVSVFAEVFEANRNALKEDQLLVVEGMIRDDAYTGGLRVSADTIYDLAGARTRFARGLSIACNGNADAGKLLSLLEPYRAGDGNGCPIVVQYANEKARGEVELPPKWNVRLDDALLSSLQDRFASDNVRVLF